MSRRRARTPTYTPPPATRRVPIQSILPKGASVMVGRPSLTRPSNNPLLLPRPKAVATLTRFDQLRRLQAELTWSRRRRYSQPVVNSAPTRKLTRPHLVRSILTRLARPSVDPRVRSPCLSRSERKQVLFARQVAGRKWGRGGPYMKNSRRTHLSYFTCRR